MSDELRDQIAKAVHDGGPIARTIDEITDDIMTIIQPALADQATTIQPKPYTWTGQGSDGFDSSGLTEHAHRTTEQD